MAEPRYLSQCNTSNPATPIELCHQQPISRPDWSSQFRSEPVVVPIMTDVNTESPAAKTAGAKSSGAKSSGAMSSGTPSAGDPSAGDKSPDKKFDPETFAMNFAR